jgi:hypothetical protein
MKPFPISNFKDINNFLPFNTKENNIEVIGEKDLSNNSNPTQLPMLKINTTNNLLLSIL